MSGGRRCPSASSLPWATIGGASFTCPSSGSLVTNYTVSFDPALGHTFATNDTATFARTVSSGGSPYYGLTMLRDGVYRIEGNAAALFRVGAAHDTVRAAIIVTGPGTASASSLYGQSPVPQANMGVQGSGIDADPQGWDLYDTFQLGMTASVAIPRGPYSINLAQEAGIDVSFLPAIVATRIGDLAAVI